MSPAASTSEADKRRLLLYVCGVQIKKIIKILASLKFAVVVILAIGTLVAWGTIVEARYMDAKIAQETVYHSWISYTIFVAFAINLIAVIVDRYPWKKHHIGFVAAHVGILSLLLGSLVTRYWGVDGSLSIPIGESGNQVMVSETDILVYTTLNGESYRKMHEIPTNFWTNPPTKEKPITINLPSGDLQITDFYRYALVDSKVNESSEPTDGPALRFQISNDRVAQTDWLISKSGQPAESMLGPARIVMSVQEYKYTGGNVLALRPINAEEVEYFVYSDKKKGLINSGKAKAGAHFNLGWMNLEFRLLKYHLHAKQEVKFVKKEQSTPETISAVQFVFKGKEGWIGLNSIARLYGDSEMYVVSYGNRRIGLNFNIALKKFDVGRYQGTMRASSYESVVSVPGLGDEIKISMNEPLKHDGYTFYQASFQEDEAGRPVASVFSVNYDPGRWIKYLGSLLIVFGSIHLFYRRWKAAKKSGGPQNA